MSLRFWAEHAVPRATFWVLWPWARGPAREMGCRGSEVDGQQGWPQKQRTGGGGAWVTIPLPSGLEMLLPALCPQVVLSVAALEDVSSPRAPLTSAAQS